MPFEISPEFKPVIEPMRIGRFQRFADAIVRGCELCPRQCKGALHDGKDASCAMGALFDGLGITIKEYLDDDGSDGAPAMGYAYLQKYDSTIVADNNEAGFTREEIAARIAAI